mmetsp:Transcript_87333/g.271303  ORF Transcript_87333/g.271303 Transcript_87333/m.271303 type:complete len:114 (+) Transcript_87333:121-462(+)
MGSLGSGSSAVSGAAGGLLLLLEGGGGGYRSWNSPSGDAREGAGSATVQSTSSLPEGGVVGGESGGGSAALVGGGPGGSGGCHGGSPCACAPGIADAGSGEPTEVVGQCLLPN